jgi:hypothetical protein
MMIVHRARPRLALALAALAACMAGSRADAADPDKPHPHQGVVEPFAGRPPTLELDSEQRKRLDSGEPVLVMIEGRDGGRGMAIQDIDASPKIVWGRIGAFDEYPRMVNHVEESEIYYAQGDDVRVRMVLSVMTFDYEYYIQHSYRPDEGYVTWTLDYSRESDLDDSVGYWAVIPHPSRPGWSRLFYSIDMRTRGWMPGFLRNMVAEQGLTDATGWVKREAESSASAPALDAPSAGPG